MIKRILVNQEEWDEGLETPEEQPLEEPIEEPEEETPTETEAEPIQEDEEGW